LYSTRCVATGDPLETAGQTTIFGQVYLQGGAAGVAAYHFDSVDECYISYEHAPSEWRLSDGSRPPARKPFENPLYDAATRTFTATITWDGANFGGDAQWVYSMTFADDFVVICAGQILAFDGDGNQTNVHSFPEALRYVRKYNLPTTITGQAYCKMVG
jgi:hypothetical protein